MIKTVSFIVFLSISSYCFSQKNGSIYSQGVCECVDSSGGVQNSLIDCIAKSIDKNMALFNQDVLQRGDTSEKAISELYNRTILRVQIDLIGSCESFFRYTDSLNGLRYRQLNKDSLKKEIDRLKHFEQSRDKKYYQSVGSLYIELGDYDNALKQSGILLSKDSLDATGLT